MKYKTENISISMCHEGRKSSEHRAFLSDILLAGNRLASRTLAV